MNYESAGAAEPFAGYERTLDAIANDDSDDHLLTATNGCINDDAKDHVLIYNGAEAVGPLVDCIRNTLTDLHATMIA